jgi:sugar/nucleoside kinase (ribokinase family)
VLVSVGDLLEEVLVRLPGDPMRGSDISVRSLRVRGGSAANVAAIDAELGASPRFVGQVGDDPIGHTLIADLRDRGVETLVEHAGVTGVVVTMIGKGGRSRMIDRGSSVRLAVLDSDCLADATHLFLSASAFTEDPFASAVDRLLGEAADRRVPVTIAGPTLSDLEGLGDEAVRELARALQPAHVILNRTEHAALGLGAREGVPGAIVTVVTNGARPTLVIDTNGAQSVEVPPVETIRDLTGAGDGFVAGFLRSRLNDAEPVAATHAGHRIAARVISQLGPTTGAKR